MHSSLPVLAAVEMGYGHLRAAQALATELGTTVLHVDRPPLVAPEELRLWRTSRRFYEITSRASQIPYVGAPLRSLLESMTDIPHLHPQRGLAYRLRATGAPLVATFFVPALSADFHRCDQIFCVVTDVDINRAWVPIAPARSRIVYLTP